MGEWLSRRSLYDLVWSQPMRVLCTRFGISDVALAKTCKRAMIPTPERGYWARKEAGKKTWVQPAPRTASSHGRRGPSRRQARLLVPNLDR